MPPKLDLVCVICNFGAIVASIHSQECVWEGGRLIHTVIHTYIKEFHTYTVSGRVQEGEENIVKKQQGISLCPLN